MIDRDQKGEKGRFSSNASFAQGGTKPGFRGMEILFLGSGAAGWPFRDYPDSQRQLTSGDFRGSSSILINRQILVDCGPTVPKAMDMFSVDPERLKHIIITHTHRDHFLQASLERVIALAGRDINLWLESGAVEKAASLQEICNLRPMKTGEELTLGDCNVLPLPANHRVSKSDETTLNFLVNCSGRKMLYALDGAWLTTFTWKAVQKLELDAVIWDATIGDLPGDYRMFAHNNLPMIRLMNESLRNNGVFTDGTRVVLSHLARNLHPPHGDLNVNLDGEGMEAAHDGMVLKLGD